MFAHTILPWISEILMLSSATLVAFGWYQIRHRRVHLHRRLMLWAAGLGAGFFITYVWKSLWVGDTSFGGPKALTAPYLTFLAIHIFLATAAAVFGVITIRLALKGRFRRHRRIAPWTATMWFVAAGTGLMVFLLLYVIFPPGPAATVTRTVLHM